MAYHPFRNLGLKFLAVALATLLWLTVAGEHVVERGMRVPLEFRNKSADLEIVGDPPTAVDVRLSGSSALLSRLDPGEIVAVLDLGTARPGSSRLFHLRPDEVRVPYGVTVDQVLPPTLSLELERSSRRTIPIVPAVEGEPAPGFVVGQITTDPASVEVIGPESRLLELTEATTETISVEGRRDGLRESVTVGVADASIRLAEARVADVTVEIRPSPVEREIENVPVRWRNLGDGMSAVIKPTLARVTVRGSREALDKLRADGVGAFVDLAGLGSGRYNLRVQVDPSQNFGVTAITPAVVDVTIR
jgi:YbbR domain-containing protein